MSARLRSRDAPGENSMLLKSLVAAACLIWAAPVSVAQDQPSRTAAGHPDLQGRWTMRTLTPFARPTGISASSVSADEEAALLDLIMQQRLAAERFDPWHISA